MNPEQVFNQHTLDPGHDMYEYIEFIRQVGEGQVVEIGVRMGVSTAAFLLSRAEHVWSVDIDPRCADLYPENSKWTFIESDSKNHDFVRAKGPMSVDVLMIDGDHSYEGLTNDLKNYVPWVCKGGLVLVHDVNAHNMLNISEKQIRDGWAGSWTSRAWNDYLAKTELWNKSTVLPGKFGMGVIQL